MHKVGVPSHMHTDNTPDFTLSVWGLMCRTHHVKQTQTEPHSPWQNAAENYGRILKKRNIPIHLWDYV